MSHDVSSRFLNRFDRIWAQARRVQLVQAVCWGVLLALAGLGLLAAIDYAFELSRTLRIVGLSVMALAAASLALGLVVISLRRWRRSATAATIEEVFPQLGQRIRTTVQFSEMSTAEIQHEGVATTLVSALEDDTVKLAQPLPLDAVIPWKSLAFASMLAAMLGLALTAAVAFDWQWNTAAQRTLLGETPYTKITVEPGNCSVREGESQVVHITVVGRIGDHITFSSRRLDEENSPWREETKSLENAEQLREHELVFLVPLDRIKHPLEYRVSAGSSETEAYQIDVLYPLKVVQIQTTVQPPEYTGIGELVIEGGNISALEGSQARIEIELDRVPEKGWLELQNMATRRDETPPQAERIPLVIEGNKLSGELTITRDQTFSIVAQAADGMELPENKQRIRARHDEPPHVWFESPAEALEVHTLAEVLMRIRASDDFGLSRAGVVFEVNNEEEYPLLSEDFAAVVEAAAEVEQTGKLSPKTRATLEKTLPLEHFELTQQDSIMYYAFAEDIKPTSAQRTETDLRFIDIRPFRRTYRALDAADGMPSGNQGPQLKTLEELISRQRYALNRTIQTSRKFQRSQQADLSGIDNLIKFEGELAKSTRELAEGLIARGIDETELLFQAETAMLAATDSLSAGSYDTATLQMRDALKNLIEGRNRLQVFIMKNRDRQQLAQLRAFDRIQQQKLRRPKSDEEEAKEIARRLEELADQEDMLYQAVASMVGGGLIDPDNTTPGEAGDKGEKDPSEQKDPEDKAAAEEGNNSEDKNNSESNADPDDKKSTDEAAEKRKMPTASELEDQQLDVATEARELEKALARLPKATELAKERIGTAAKAAEEGAGSLGKGENDDAQKSIHEAGGTFRELADQVRALLAEEQAQQIAAAQQMAAELARRQDDFADKLANAGEGGGLGKPKEEDEDQTGLSDEEKKKRAEDEKRAEEERQGGLGAAAEEIAEKAKTLADVLGAAGGSDKPEDQAAAEKLKTLAAELDLNAVIERLQKLPDQIGNGQEEDAKASAGDGAERMEAAAEQLAALHRVIVTPQVDELAKVEEKIAVLTEELEQLDTETKVAGWHEDANDLLDDLDAVGIDDKPRQEFQDAMKRLGWANTGSRKENWALVDGRYRSPAAYRAHLLRLQAAVQGRMQELMLGDLLSSGDEPIPPQYQDFVDKYYQVLSRRAGDGTAPKPTRIEK
jgi:hypothetical protein